METIFLFFRSLNFWHHITRDETLRHIKCVTICKVLSRNLCMVDLIIHLSPGFIFESSNRIAWQRNHMKRIKEIKRSSEPDFQLNFLIVLLQKKTTLIFNQFVSLTTTHDLCHRAWLDMKLLKSSYDIASCFVANIEYMERGGLLPFTFHKCISYLDVCMSII